MADVVFYVLQSTEQSVAGLACRLCHRISIVAKQPLFVRFSRPEQMAAFDDLLWSFSADSFVPHAIDDLRAEVCLGLQEPHVGFVGCCLNLADDAADATAFDRVIEIIGADEATKQLGRQRFKHYRQLGISPQTHQV